MKRSSLFLRCYKVKKFGHYSSSKFERKTTNETPNSNDAENKQVKVETVNSGGAVTGTVGEYFYDGDGKRIKKRAYVDNVPTEETIFVYDAAGKLIAEHSNQVASSQDAMIAYLTIDHLGSPRINTDINGNVTSRHDYHPFGEDVGSSDRAAGLGYIDDTVRKEFTGYELDIETELDFAQARMYASRNGRFTTGDPLLSTGTLSDPQTWNRYPFSLNRPTILKDPTGLYVCKNLTTTECDTFEAARLKAETNLVKLAEKYKDKGGINSKEYKKAERALLAYGRRGDDNGVYIVKGGSDRGAVTPGVLQKKTGMNPLGQTVNVTFKADSLDPSKELRLDEVVIHEGSHAADVSDWFKSGRLENPRFSQYNGEFEAYTVSSLYAEATGRGTVGYDVDAPEPYTRFIFPAVIWDQSWSDVDKETLRSNGIDRLLRWDKNYLGGGPDKQILPNRKKK
jgi:RHS repeat-associated protein